MNTLTRLLLTSAILVIGNEGAYAQNGQKLRDATLSYTNDRCHLCDSLANAYLQAGDTSMAIYYYGQYVEAHPEDVDHKNILLRQIKMYNRRQSFYLTDH